MNRIRTLLVALLSIAVLAAGLGGAPTMSVQPRTPSTLVAVADVRSESRPGLRREEAPTTAIIGNLSDSGGTELSGRTFRSDKEVDEGGTPQAVAYRGEHMFFGGTGEAMTGQRGAPVVTVEKSSRHINHDNQASQTRQDTMGEKGDGAQQTQAVKAAEEVIPGYG